MNLTENLKGSSEKPPLIIIAGPTATGKSRCAVTLAERTGGEVISADSMQVYKGMDIGSAKITPDEMRGVPHHLIDILEPTQTFNVCTFQKLAMKAADEILKRGHIPIVAGGTGFYIRALVYGTDFTGQETDSDYRENLELRAANGEGEKLFEELKLCDPESARCIHPNNLKRVIRALEYYHLSGEPISGHNSRERQKESIWNCAYFVLTDDREKLYERIDRRVDQMLEDGLANEVASLQSRGLTRDMVSMQGLGYKEMIDCLEGRISFSEAVRIIKRDTRHFAKRQLTWFRRERDVIWIDRSALPDEDAVISEMLKVLKEKGIVKT